MGPALSFIDRSSRRTWWAGALSIVAHLGLLWVIATGATILPPTEPLSPLRFVGQTFDIDAIGDDDQDEASPSGDDASPTGTPPEALPSSTDIPDESGQDDPEQEPVSQDDPEDDERDPPQPKPEYHAPAPPPFPRKAPTPERTESNKPETPEPVAPKKPPVPKKPVDPFDLGLPGEPTSGASPSAPSETGSYGAEGDTAPVTDVFNAFLHLFPEANRHNPAFRTLPKGPVGRVEFFITIGKNARLVSIQIEQDDAKPAPPILIEAIRKTQAYLHHQRLGWEGERREGRQRLALTVKVEGKAPHPDTPEREGTQRHGRYGESRPTGAFFTYYDGHHIDIELERLP